MSGLQETIVASSTAMTDRIADMFKTLAVKQQKQLHEMEARREKDKKEEDVRRAQDKKEEDERRAQDWQQQHESLLALLATFHPHQAQNSSGVLSTSLLSDNSIPRSKKGKTTDDMDISSALPSPSLDGDGI